MELTGRVTEVSPEQPLNAPYPMSETVVGIVSLVKPLQSEKEYLPMVVTVYLDAELGMVSEPLIE